MTISSARQQTGEAVSADRLHLTVLPQVWHERPKTRGDCLTAEEHEAAIRRAWAEANPWLNPADAPIPSNLIDGINCERPCPWLSCRHHLASHVHGQTGELLVHPGIDENNPDLTKLEATCSLDVAEDGETSMMKIGRLLGTTEEYIHRVFRRAQERGRAGGGG